jgi:hypothetical protein
MADNARIEALVDAQLALIEDPDRRNALGVDRGDAHLSLCSLLIHESQDSTLIGGVERSS